MDAAERTENIKLPQSGVIQNIRNLYLYKMIAVFEYMLAKLFKYFYWFYQLINYQVAIHVFFHMVKLLLDKVKYIYETMNICIRLGIITWQNLIGLYYHLDDISSE